MSNKAPRTDHIEKYQFTTERQESCTAHLSLRITPSLKAKLKKVDNWQEEVRKTLENLVQPESA